MKFAYEKLLLGFGGLALLVSIVFYAISFNQNFGDSTILGQLNTNRYEPIPVPTFDKDMTIWPNVEEQAAGELYDVFTPPAIWIDKDGTFQFKSPIDNQPPIPFGVYLAELENEPYRIQLEGYVEEDFKDAKKSVLLLFDEEKKQSIRARVGQTIKEHEFSVYNFTIDRIQDSNGIVKLAVATILDFRDGRRIFLTHGERRYKENVTVILRSRENPEVEIKITKKPPVDFKIANAKYSLEKINLEESSVTVRKFGDGALESETRQLFIKYKNESKKTSNKSLELKTDSSNQFFDFDF